MEQLQSHIWGRTSYYMRKCPNISSYMRRPLVIYIWLRNCSILNCLLYKENFIFFFNSVIQIFFMSVLSKKMFIFTQTVEVWSNAHTWGSKPSLYKKLLFLHLQVFISQNSFRIFPIESRTLLFLAHWYNYFRHWRMLFRTLLKNTLLETQG